MCVIVALTGVVPLLRIDSGPAPAQPWSGMTVDPRLLERARRSPHTISFDAALRLGRQLGFRQVRHVRGHRILHHAAHGPLSLQEGPRGRAKAYQVRTLPGCRGA
jgi:hypothetical protein